MDLEAVGTFFDRSWKLYETIVGADYLFHGPIYTLLGQRLAERGPFSLLELGCGDARFTRPALEGTRLQRYRGIDLAPEALELARRNLAGLPAELLQGNLLELDETRFDLALASYSVHHLSLPEKERLLGLLRARVTEFWMVDLCLDEGETREQYLARRRAIPWPALTPEQRDEVFAHESSADFPESLATWQALAARTGWSAPELLYTDPHRMGRFLIFR